ncbi:GntR family transcriptional regulator/MocR family aminotransferase [Herbaspirillum sp. Sphag1AN]|uniref:MocR-like pyridoxine biosynthesis transcription factor PdxR n=1 Tax=unclassified Herbaspirillum TaxID=2624150 RepID=UPI0016155A58|nr:MULTISPECIES: PLP-dependent aminotransferase family protein [unclassified Herbaspirillum]MBB3212746.1 GntR family transcriptional regulator/MocR family aminotransferase [Herbaspirillum sp. Sphag1AN]MBB3245943.1 GntR family transcriptional regulator/MocR family aminotransferase [Herbaspirillum sp. Sphag64]
MSKISKDQSTTSGNLHAQIYSRLRNMIEQGQLKAGQRVSSLRTMAVELGVARGTVQVAYDRLIGEGYLVARGPAGTFVAAAQLAQQARQHHALHATDPRPASGVDVLAAREVKIDFGGAVPAALQLGLPALDAFPRKLWQRLMARQIAHSHALTNPSPMGYAPLRSALISYLGASRGIEATPAQLFIIPSYRAGLALTINALALNAGEAGLSGSQAWIENPGYPPTARVLQQLGVQPCCIPVDDQGLDVAYAQQHYQEAKLAIVTPSHQSPTGVALSLSRRRSLLEWAAQQRGWIVEDDYDSEYRYRGHPLPALKSLDDAERVIYCGTLSKVMFPGLRLAYVVVPPSLVEAFTIAANHAVYGGCPELQQAAVTEFIVDGYFSRHIKRMRALYASRREFLVEALTPYEAHGFKVRLHDGGMHLLLDIPAGQDDRLMAQAAQAAGFGIQALSVWTKGDARHHALMVGFTNVDSLAEAERQVVRLMQVLTGNTF